MNNTFKHPELEKNAVYRGWVTLKEIVWWLHSVIQYIAFVSWLIVFYNMASGSPDLAFRIAIGLLFIHVAAFFVRFAITVLAERAIIYVAKGENWRG